MMFKNALAFLSLAFVASATTVPRDTCWTGNIHYPCNGATTGCTPDGMLVTCDGSGSMIYSNACGFGDGAKGTCGFDADCNASCQ